MEFLTAKKQPSGGLFFSVFFRSVKFTIPRGCSLLLFFVHIICKLPWLYVEVGLASTYKRC